MRGLVRSLLSTLSSPNFGLICAFRLLSQKLSSKLSHYANMATQTDEAVAARKPTSSLDSSFPCELPQTPALFLSSVEFEEHVRETFADIKAQKQLAESEEQMAELAMQHVDGKPFMKALMQAKPTPKRTELEASLAKENKMLGQNLDVAFKSTNSALLDLFTELEKAIANDRLKSLLDLAWKEDALATLKIVWNARSIHLGKGEQESFYKCLGWMKNEHPVTVISNLQWLYRSVIEKKIKKDDEDAMVVVDAEGKEAEEVDEYEVLHGVSHGYWKDLLSILVLAVNDELEVSEKTRHILHKPNNQRIRNHRFGNSKKRKRTNLPNVTETPNQVAEAKATGPLSTEEQKLIAKHRKHTLEQDRHKIALQQFEDPFYRCLHLSVARLFAQQLKADKEALDSDDSIQKSRVSLAAKWAPSLEGFHDKHTMIATTIAEFLFPRDLFPSEDSRELYLKHARESYRAKYLSPLRRHLDVVERKITSESFSKIAYSKVPSLAMDSYKNLFVKKDLEHFSKYIEKVAAGKTRISGAVLTPGSLIHQARIGTYNNQHTSYHGKDKAKALLASKAAAILSKALDGQWNSLVQRIKDNGTLSSTIAVCDVSGSMSRPAFPDDTCPLDHSVGLSLLIAEVTTEPFGGCFITFSSNPHLEQVGGKKDTRGLKEKVSGMCRSDWSMNTDFVAVFERLLLPVAVENKISQEDMVKQVIVFSDMHFDAAQGTNQMYGSYGMKESTEKSWGGSFERIKARYAEAGYEMPRLVFWNLAAGKGSSWGNNGGREVVAPKPVTKEEVGTMIVSGYSQGMLKMFLDKGGFDEEEAEEEGAEDEEMEEVKVGEDGEVETETKTVEGKKKKTVDPMSGMRKAIGHKAYDMLKVVD